MERKARRGRDVFPENLADMRVVRQGGVSPSVRKLDRDQAFERRLLGDNDCYQKIAILLVSTVLVHASCAGEEHRRHLGGTKLTRPSVSWH